MSKSYLERIALALIEDAGLPKPIEEYRFCPERKWRADFVWLFNNQLYKVDPLLDKVTRYKGVILEINGAVWTKGKHTYGKQLLDEYEKLNNASLDGWILIQVGNYHMKTGQMIEWLKRALALGDKTSPV